MSSAGPWIARYAARVDELTSLQTELASPRRPGDPAPVIDRVLAAAGDLLRRRGQVPFAPPAVDAVLRAVGEAALRSWVEGLDLQGLAKALARAADEAVEAALPDAPDDGAALAAWAVDGLRARDRLESALVALARLEELGRADAGQHRAALAPRVDALDGRARRAVLSLTSLNPARRAEADLLDGAHRARAWWWSERCEAAHDALVRTLGGEGQGGGGLEVARVDAVVGRRRRRGVGFDELLRLDLGVASAAEVETVKRQAQADPELARALEIMAEADQAIADLERAEARPAAQPLPAPEPGPKVQVLEDHGFCTVLLFRRKQRAYLVLEPRQERFAAVAVYLPGGPDRPRPARRNGRGFEVDLGPEDGLGPVQVRAVLQLGTRETRELTIAIPGR